MKQTPKILNILGLAVAIAAFMVVAMVRYYDLRYDKSYPGADRIYSVWLMSIRQFSNETQELSLMASNSDFKLLTGVSLDDPTKTQPSVLPFEEMEEACIMSGYGWGWKRVATENGTSRDTISKVQLTIPSYFPFFGIKIKEGSLDKFTDFRNAVISNRLAKILFPHGSAIGQKIVLSSSEEPINASQSPSLDTLTVIAVFKDLPQNSSLYDYDVVRHYPPGKLAGDVYVKVKDTTMVNILKNKMLNCYQTAYHNFWDNVDTTGDEALSQAEYDLKYKDAPNKIDDIRLSSLHDDYHSPNNFWNFEAKQFTTMSKALSIFGIVLLLLAFLNFTNYAVATVPMFLRKTNIRKIEGCSNAQLRWEMFGRFLLSAVIAFLIALVIVEVCARTKVIPFVEISLKLADNLPVVWISAAVTLLVAVVASLYPVFYTTAAANVESALKSQLATPEKYGKWRKLLLRMQTTPASVVQFFASFAIILFLTLVFVQNHYMKTADVGFETENIYVSKLEKSAPNATDNIALRGYQEDFRYKDLDSLKGEWKKLGEIADVTWSENPVLGLGESFGMMTLMVGNETLEIADRTVSNNFFRFFGIKIVEGKDFEEVCDESHTGIIINEAALKLSKQWETDSNRTNVGVIGVAQNFHNMPLINEIDPCIYFAKCNSGLVWNNPFIYIKLKDADKQEVDSSLVNQMNTACVRLGHMGPFTALKDVINKEYEKEDDFAKLMALFGAVTLFVTLTGLFGMVLLECMYRRRELALRRVYGASTGNQLWKMLRNQLIICIVCFAAATPLAVGLFHKWQQHFAFKSGIPVWVFIAVFLTVTLLALAITAWQTLRTLREEPVLSL